MKGILSFAALAVIVLPGGATNKNVMRCRNQWSKGCNPLSKNLYQQVIYRISIGV